VRGFGIGGSEPGGDHDNTSCCGIHHGGSSKVSPRVRVSSFFLSRVSDCGNLHS
jgi:hypothetical protein